MTRFLLISYICFLSASTKSQTGSTGIGTTTPHASSILDINSNNKGVLLPRVSSSQRKSIASPAPGLLVYDTDKRTIFMFDGTQWLPMMVAASGTNTIPEIVAPGNPTFGENVGWSVDVSGNYLISGSPEFNAGQGAAYIFFKQNGVWTQQAKLTASDGAAGDRFGTSVATNGDWAVVTSYLDDILTSNPPFIINHEDRGSVYIFQRNGSNWTQTAKLTSTIAADFVYYGVSVAMDGDRFIVGSFGDDGNGAAYVYQRSGSLWVLQQRIVATDGTIGDEFGATVDIKGNYLIVGATAEDNGSFNNVGAAYIFFHNGVTWTQQQKFTGAQELQESVGSSVAISDSLALVGNSTTLVSGFDNHGEVRAYRRNGTNWSVITNLAVPDHSENARVGWDISLHGELAIVSALNGTGTVTDQGTTYVYRYIDRTWRFQHKINDPQGMTGFGWSVATDGLHFAIGTGRLPAGAVAIVNCE